MPENYNVLIIGGGVVGCMTAHFLSRYQMKILLIEKEEESVYPNPSLNF